SGNPRLVTSFSICRLLPKIATGRFNARRSKQNPLLAATTSLLSEGFAERGSFTVRRGPLSGRTVVTFDPSPEGRSWFDDIREWKQDLFDAGLTDLVTDTFVVDNGHGVVATRTMVEIALEIGDGALLKRQVDPAAPLGIRQGLDIEDRVTPEVRREAQVGWLGEDVPRSGAAIVDLGGVLRGFSVRVE
ncbi:hypothetical protein, partial [Donghicola mangrovi]|uniref:hypothetical protein n=1 Tax=Donghicola mangrovi TaxID=2729614 RepID=UPI001D14D6D3